MTQSAVSLIASRNTTVTAMAVLERIADGLEMPDGSRMRLGLAPEEVDSVRRRTALGLGLAATLTPSTLTNVLRESAAEALEFTRGTSTSAVGTGTLEQLAAVITELDRANPWRPAAELFPVARAYRHQIARLIDGQHTLKEARELYAYAAHLSYLLSDLAHDLGSSVTAEAYAIDCYRHADQAGHDELCAWACSSLACWALYARQPAKAVAAAERGIGRAPRRSPIAARLHANAGRVYARQGNKERCTERLDQARKLSDRLPDESPVRLATESGAMTSSIIGQHTADSHVWLADYQDAAREARAAFAVAAWSPGRADEIRLTLAMALANLGSPDEAVEHATQALAQARYLGSLLSRTRELDAALMSRYATETRVQEFHDRYRQLTSRAIMN